MQQECMIPDLTPTPPLKKPNPATFKINLLSELRPCNFLNLFQEETHSTRKIPNLGFWNLQNV